MAYTEEQRADIISKVITGLSKGIPLTVICSEDGMPCDDTVRNWAEADEQLSRAIARAREAGWDALAYEGLTIVDDKTEDPASRRVRADYRLKLLAKWDPKRYGERLALAGDAGAPLTVTLQPLDDRL